MSKYKIGDHVFSCSINFYWDGTYEPFAFFTEWEIVDISSKGELKLSNNESEGWNEEEHIYLDLDEIYATYEEAKEAAIKEIIEKIHFHEPEGFEKTKEGEADD